MLRLHCTLRCKQRSIHENGHASIAWFCTRTDSSSALTRDHADIADIELDVLHHLAALQVDLDGIVDLNQRVRVADSAPVIGGDVGDATVTNLLVADAAQLVLRANKRKAHALAHELTYLLQWCYGPANPLLCRTLTR